MSTKETYALDRLLDEIRRIMETGSIVLPRINYGTLEAWEGYVLAALRARVPDAPEHEGALNALGAEIIKINRANGWKVVRSEEWPVSEGVGDTYKIGTILALIHSEVSEALEAVRKYDRENFEEELADVLIRVLDCAAGLGVDMDATVRTKLERNRQRGFRHGGKAV